MTTTYVLLKKSDRGWIHVSMREDGYCPSFARLDAAEAAAARANAPHGAAHHAVFSCEESAAWREYGCPMPIA